MLPTVLAGERGWFPCEIQWAATCKMSIHEAMKIDRGEKKEKKKSRKKKDKTNQPWEN